MRKRKIEVTSGPVQKQPCYFAGRSGIIGKCILPELGGRPDNKWRTSVTLNRRKL